MTAMNAKQKRKAKQLEKGESTEESEEKAAVKSEDVKPKSQQTNGKQKKPFGGKQQQKSGGKPGGQKQNKRPKVA
jgi:hypothetical protein